MRQDRSWCILLMANSILTMHAGHDQCCPFHAHKQLLMQAWLMLCFLWLNHAAKFICEGHYCCCRVDAPTPQLLCACLGCCWVSLVDISWSIHTSHNLCLLDDALRPWFNFPVLYEQATSDTTVHDQHRQRNVENPQPILAILDQCYMVDASFYWPTFLSQSTHHDSCV